MKKRNVIFDFGQVMVHFEPEYMVGKYVSDSADARLLETVVFDRLYWDRLDSGSITDAQVTAAFRERLPERLWEAADTIYCNWIYNIPEVEGMRELVAYIKQRYGTRVFLLSNISNYFAEHKDEIPCLAEFEHCVFSAAVGMIKPHRDIFEHICKVCDIRPEETVFVDDNKANIAGAEEYGITGYLFDGDAEKLKEYLDKAL